MRDQQKQMLNDMNKQEVKVSSWETKVGKVKKTFVYTIVFLLSLYIWETNEIDNNLQIVQINTRLVNAKYASDSSNANSISNAWNNACLCVCW